MKKERTAQEVRAEIAAIKVRLRDIAGEVLIADGTTWESGAVYASLHAAAEACLLAEIRMPERFAG